MAAAQGSASSYGGQIQQASNQPPFYDPNGTEDGDRQDGEWSGESDGEEDRKRKRPMSVSCEMCKQRKVKCDRGQPACGWCVKNNHLCEYKERKKPGLRAGYGRELEARLDRLEDLIQRHDAILNQGGHFTNPSSTASAGATQEANMFASPTSMQATPGAHTEMPGLPQQIPTTSSMFTPQTPGMESYQGSYSSYNGQYDQNATDPYGKQGPPYLQEPQPNFFRSELPHISTDTLNSAPEGPAPPPQDDDFPSYDLLYTLVDLFFKHVNPWCPILHRKTTQESLFSSSGLEEADRVLLHAIVATTLRFSTDPRLTPEKKQKYHSMSEQKVLFYGFFNSNVKALQALTILAVDLVGSSNGPPGWNLLALITRSAVQLGLSIEIPLKQSSEIPKPLSKPKSLQTVRAIVLSEPTSWIEEESRRRLFWMIYILDRYATITTAIGFALDEREIDRRLPCRDDLWSRNQPLRTRFFRADQRTEKEITRPDDLGSFSYYVDIVGILSEIHQFLRRPLDICKEEEMDRWKSEYKSFDAKIKGWMQSLPKEYGDTSRLTNAPAGGKTNPGWVMLHVAYHTTMIRLHSSAAYPTHTSPPIFVASYNAAEHCRAAVDGIADLCLFAQSNKMLSKFGPPFAWSVWVASRLLLVRSATIEHDINAITDKIALFLDVLRDLGLFWKVADRYATILKHVLDELTESEQAPVTGNGGRTVPTSVKIIKDMRRCAYDVDFLITNPKRMCAAQTAARVDAAEAEGSLPHDNVDFHQNFWDIFDWPRLPNSIENAMDNGADAFQVQQFGQPSSIVNYDENLSGFSHDTRSDWFGN